MERQISTGWLMFISFRAAEDRIFAALAAAGFGDITRAQGRLLAGIDLNHLGFKVVEHTPTAHATHVVLTRT